MTTAAALEAVLFVAEAPVPTGRLAEVLGITRKEVLAEIEELSRRLQSPHRGLSVERVAGGWRLYTLAELSGYVEKFVSRQPVTSLSPAAREVLAVVAYRQPVTRNQISEIRGVDSVSAVRTLERAGLIEVVERLRLPGNPGAYGTTGAFLEKLGLDSLEELPSLSGSVPSPEVMDDLAAASFGA